MSKQPSTAELLQQLLAIEALRLADDQKKRQEAAEQQDAAAEEDKQAAEEKAKKEAEAERKAAEEKAKKKLEESQKAAAADLGAVATGLGKLSGSTVAFPEKSVFREGRASAAALQVAAAKVAGVVGRVSGAGSKRVLLTSRTDQLQTILAAASFAEAVKMLLKLAALELRPLPVYPPAVPPTVATDAAAEEAAAEAVAEAAAEEAAAAAEAADVSSVVGGAVDAAVALFNLLSVETTVESSSRNATELETQVPVLAALLAGETKVVHETIALPTPDPALQRDFATLATKPALLNAVAERSAAAIKGLGDKPDPVHLSTLTARKEDAEALSTQISDFVTKAQTPDADTKITPLGGALAAQRVIGGPDSPTQLVAIVQPARISADQIALKRRLFAPRVVVSAVATIDVVVLDVPTGLIVAAESCVGEHVFQVRFPMGWWSSNEWRPYHETLALADDPPPSDLNDITRLSRRVEALEAGTVPPPA